MGVRITALSTLVVSKKEINLIRDSLIFYRDNVASAPLMTPELVGDEQRAVQDLLDNLDLNEPVKE